LKKAGYSIDHQIGFRCVR